MAPATNDNKNFELSESIKLKMWSYVD